MFSLLFARHFFVNEVFDFRILHRLPGAADGGSLKMCGEKCVGIIAWPALGGGSVDADEAGEISIFGSQPIHHPGTDRRTNEIGGTGVKKQRCRSVGDTFGVHAADDTQIVDDFRLFGEKIGDPGTGVAVLPEVPGRFLQSLLLNSEISGIVEFECFAVVFGEAFFWVEGIDLTRASLHEDKDHPFCFGRMV